MLLGSLSQIDGAIRACWSRETCDPVDIATGRPPIRRAGSAGSRHSSPRPAGRGLLIAEVRHADGTRQGVHYWNRLSDGLELDLTRAQFSRGAVVGIPEVVSGR